MKKLLSIISSLVILAGVAFGQGGTATPVRSGPSFPSPAPYLYLFGLTSGSVGVYSCNHSPTCTTSGQWVGPIGSGGGGGGCSSTCADTALDNLSNVAISALSPLTPAAGFDLTIGYTISNPLTSPAVSNINIFGSSSLGGAVGAVNVAGGNGANGHGSPSNVGGKVNINGGPGGSTSNGGDVDIMGGIGADDTGTASGNGGNVVIAGGPTNANTTGDGGNVLIEGALPNTGTLSSSEGFSQCNSTLGAGTCLWNISGGTETVTVATGSVYWGWVTAGVSSVTVSGSSGLTSCNGTFTVQTVFTGAHSGQPYAQFTWPNAGTAGTCSGLTLQLNGTYSVNTGTPGVVQIAGGGATLISPPDTGGVEIYSGTPGTPGEIDLDTLGPSGVIKVIGVISNFGADGATVEQGVVSEPEEYNSASSAKTANVSGTLIASATGKYRINAWSIIKIAAAGGSPSSTLPSISVTYTDADAGISVTQQISATSSANTVGTLTSGMVIINPVAASAVTFTTGSTYTSSGSTVMQYVPHIIAEHF
jgi:filamentous hemagglutinin